MKAAFYIGDHAGDTPLVRAGWWITRAFQKGDVFKDCTHCEAILEEHADGTVDIGSASLRDGAQVRTKCHVRLTPGNWLIADVPSWSRERSADWFIKHNGDPYDLLGAVASPFPVVWQGRKGRFCSEALAESAGMYSPWVWGPALLATAAFSFGRDVTEDFFRDRL